MSYIRYQPVNNKILVRFTKPDRAVILPDNVGDPVPDIEVIAISSEVAVCKPGDKILPRPDVNIHTLETDKHSALCLIDASAIVAIDLGPEISLAG